jgi:hypothetical protein
LLAVAVELDGVVAEALVCDWLDGVCIEDDDCVDVLEDVWLDGVFIEDWSDDVWVLSVACVFFPSFAIVLVAVSKPAAATPMRSFFILCLLLVDKEASDDAARGKSRRPAAAGRP